MASTPKRPHDPNQLAKFIVDVATGGLEEELSKKTNEAQSKGGRSGGRARAEKLAPERRAEIARKAARARWEETSDV